MTKKSLCRTGKVEFKTREEAEATVTDLKKIHDYAAEGKRAPENAYECPYCLQWHLARGNTFQKKIPGRRVRGAYGKKWETK